MIFGDQSTFAIACDIRSNDGKYTFVMGNFWIGGERVGAPDEVMLLSALAMVLEDFVERKAERVSEAMFVAERETLLGDLKAMIYDGVAPGGSRHVLQRTFVLCPNGCEAFDGWFAVVVENKERRQRLVWSKSQDARSANEIVLADGTVEQVMNLFLTWGRTASRRT